MSATRSRTSLNCCTGSRPSVPPGKSRTTAAPPSVAFSSLTQGPSTSWFSAPGGGGKLANFSSTCAGAVAGASNAAANSSAVHRHFIVVSLLLEENAAFCTAESLFVHGNRAYSGSQGRSRGGSMDSQRRRMLGALGGVAVGAVTGCASSPARERLHFVLVHGAWHGAWCWERIVPLLREQGHEVTAVDLQGQGAARLPAEQVNLGVYVKRVTDALDAQGAPAILVGHSSGCLAASQ